MSEYNDVFPFRKEVLVGPILYDENDGDVEVLSFTELLPAGEYWVSVNLVNSFDQAGDVLSWHVIGDVISPVFVDEAVSSSGLTPYNYTFPLTWIGGLMGIDLEVAINGAGTATAAAVDASIMVKRVA